MWPCREKGNRKFTYFSYIGRSIKLFRHVRFQKISTHHCPLRGYALCTGFRTEEHKHDDEKATNLKVLPANTSGEDLHKIMRAYSMALGVRCGHCHVSHEVPGKERPEFDFASDAKPEKEIARDMMRMTAAINVSYLAKIKDEGRPLEQITCVTCHMGRKTPIISVDSLVRKDAEKH